MACEIKGFSLKMIKSWFLSRQHHDRIIMLIDTSDRIGSVNRTQTRNHMDFLEKNLKFVARLCKVNSINFYSFELSTISCQKEKSQEKLYTIQTWHEAFNKLRLVIEQWKEKKKPTTMLKSMTTIGHHIIHHMNVFNNGGSFQTNR